MKMKFTHLLQLAVFTICANCLVAQNANKCTVTEPMDIAGSYTAIQASFGSAANSLVAAATFVNDGENITTDGCDGTIQDLTGKIAFIDREGRLCQFGTKALAAQNANAVGAIICNSSEFAGQGVPGLVPGDDGGSVTIPVWGMSYDDCLIIRQFAEGGDIQVTMGYECSVPSYPSRVIWGTNPGEGDFENGLNNWRVESQGDTSWAWTTDPNIPGFFTNATFESPTSCNGFMLFASDHLDNNSEMNPNTGSANFGVGPCLSGPSGGPCIGSVISPEIDLSGQQIDGLLVRFTQSFRYFVNTYTAVIASYDGGVTWPDTVRTAPFSEVNAANVTETVEVPLRMYNGESTVSIQFYHEGNYYYYALDDVTLVNDSYFDIRVSDVFYSAAPTWGIPQHQVQEMSFTMDIFNEGNVDGTDIVTEAEVFAPDGSSLALFTNDDYSDQPAFEFVNENNAFEEFYVPPAEVGQYTVQMRNVSEGDNDTSNDVIEYGFNVTENTWQTCPQPTAAANGNWPSFFDGLIFDDPSNANFIGYKYAIGYSFYLPRGAGRYLNSLRWGVDDKARNSGFINTYLYLWNPSPDDFGDDEASGATIDALGNWVVNSDDLLLLGTMGEDNFQGQTNSQLLNIALGSQRDMTTTLALADPATGQPNLTSDGQLRPVPLQDDQRYLLVYVINPTNGATTDDFVEFLASSAIDNVVERQWNPSGTNLANDVNDLDRYYGAMAKPLSTGSFDEVNSLDWDGVIGAQFFTLLDNNMPWIEMDISSTPNSGNNWTSTNDIATEDEQSVNTYPNPVVDMVNVEITLAKNSKQLSLELNDIHGKLVKIENFQNVQRETIQLSVADIPGGVYTLNVRSEFGVTSQKVIISK